MVKSERGIIVQDFFASIPPDAWKEISDAGVTHAFIGVPWANVEREPGSYDWTQTGPRIEAALEAGLTVIVRVLWPVPAWAPRSWAARTVEGKSTFDADLFFRIAHCPSFWCVEAWDALFKVQDLLAFHHPQIELSPPGSGGGEWTHPTSHALPGRELEVRQLWCFDECALADYHLAYRAGEVETSEPPSTIRQAHAKKGFLRWYNKALRYRMWQCVNRSLRTPWIALIPKPGAYDDLVCAGQPGLDEFASGLECNFIIHCMFGRGNDDISRAYCFDWIEKWDRPVAVGVEEIQGLAVNAQTLARTHCTHLLIGSQGLLENIEHLRFWCRYWKDWKKYALG